MIDYTQWADSRDEWAELEGMAEPYPNGYLFDVYSETCMPCMQMMKILPKWEQDTGVPVIKVNVDKETELLQRLGIRKVPTFVYYRDDKEVARHVGVARLSELTEMVGL